MLFFLFSPSSHIHPFWLLLLLLYLLLHIMPQLQLPIMPQLQLLTMRRRFLHSHLPMSMVELMSMEDTLPRLRLRMNMELSRVRIFAPDLQLLNFQIFRRVQS